jgi:hypothetical protein
MTLDGQHSRWIALMRDISFFAASFCIALHDAAEAIGEERGPHATGKAR